MRTYQEQRQHVIDLQDKIAAVRHKLENPRRTMAQYYPLMNEMERLSGEHDREIRIMWGYDEYQGKFKEAASNV